MGHAGRRAGQRRASGRPGCDDAGRTARSPTARAAASRRDLDALEAPARCVPLRRSRSPLGATPCQPQRLGRRHRRRLRPEPASCWASCRIPRTTSSPASTRTADGDLRAGRSALFADGVASCRELTGCAPCSSDTRPAASARPARGKVRGTRTGCATTAGCSSPPIGCRPSTGCSPACRTRARCSTSCRPGGSTETADVVANHLLAVPDPNVAGRRGGDAAARRGRRARLHHRASRRPRCGASTTRASRDRSTATRFPDGLRKNTALPTPIITPTTKAAQPVPTTSRSTCAEVVARGLVDAALWDAGQAAALELFRRGQDARRRGRADPGRHQVRVRPRRRRRARC